jgi:hypothetical protein
MKRLPEQLFFRTVLAAQSNFFSVRWKSIFPAKNSFVLVRFCDRFWVLFGPISGCFFGQGLLSVGVDVCVCLCVVVIHNRVIERLAGRVRPHDSPARPTLPHNVR